MTLICKQNSCGDMRCRCAADAHTGNPACRAFTATWPDHQLITFPHMNALLLWLNLFRIYTSPLDFQQTT